MTDASFDEQRDAAHAPALHDHPRGIAHVGERPERVRQTAAERRRLFADVLAAQEQTRRRLADDLHDGGLQAMVVVLLRLGQLKGGLVADSPQSAVLAELELSVRDAITNIRQLIAGLVPRELDRDGLASAVRSLLGDIGAESGIQCRLEQRLHQEPRPSQRAMAFRITHEALANARSHARPSRIDVLLESRDGGVGACVADDGVGFVVGATAEDARLGHLGLAAMRGCLEMAGGWLRIDSSAEGSAVSFWIPDAGPNEVAP
jgi:signal transduction histidine kinase